MLLFRRCYPRGRYSHLYKQRLVLVCLIRLDLDDALGLGLKSKVPPQCLLQTSRIAAQLVSILLGQLSNPEGPAIMRAGKGNIAQLRLKVVFFVFQINLALLSPRVVTPQTNIQYLKRGMALVVKHVAGDVIWASHKLKGSRILAEEHGLSSHM